MNRTILAVLLSAVAIPALADTAPLTATAIPDTSNAVTQAAATTLGTCMLQGISTQAQLTAVMQQFEALKKDLEKCHKDGCKQVSPLKAN